MAANTIYTVVLSRLNHRTGDYDQIQLANFKDRKSAEENLRRLVEVGHYRNSDLHIKVS